VWCSDCRANRRTIARANRAVKGGGANYTGMIGRGCVYVCVF